MKLNGTEVAQGILASLKTDVAKLTTQGIIPTLSVILVGSDPASLSYIRQKQKAAETIGATVNLHQLAEDTTAESLKELLAVQNANRSVHGIIIQRPLPKTSTIPEDVLMSIVSEKDVDGFLPKSPFTVPVAKAVGVLLFEAKEKSLNNNLQQTWSKFISWLTTQQVVVLGRGETAGRPIAQHLTKLGCPVLIVHSQTPQPETITRHADIIISCVGKERVLTKVCIKQGAIVISVGIWRDSLGKLHGDYEEDEIKDIAGWYTPTPGGVGPVNVACLMQNLVLAAGATSSTSH